MLPAGCRPAGLDYCPTRIMARTDSTASAKVDRYAVPGAGRFGETSTPAMSRADIGNDGAGGNLGEGRIDGQRGHLAGGAGDIRYDYGVLPCVGKLRVRQSEA